MFSHVLVSRTEALLVHVVDITIREYSWEVLQSVLCWSLCLAGL